MPRKPHPTDCRDAEIIGNAVRFEISLFLGVGRFATGAAATLTEARVAAERLAAANPSSRRPLIYAIDAQGRAAPIGNSIQPRKECVS
jgi:hypothetical protein